MNGIDENNPVVKLCIEGTRAEFRKNKEEACACYRKAWDHARNDYEACIAAHYMARCFEDTEEVLRWNREALQRADAVEDGRAAGFYPSLYLNLGHSCELAGDLEEARRYYDLAASSNAGETPLEG